MPSDTTRSRCLLVGGVFGLTFLVGCSMVGPAALSRGRVAYNEVIAATDDEQSLAYIVKLRYGITASLLAVPASPPALSLPLISVSMRGWVRKKTTPGIWCR